MDIEDMFAFELDEHMKETVHERMDKLAGLYIQELPDDIKDGIMELLRLEVRLENARLVIQLGAADEYISDQLAQTKRRKMSTINKVKKDS